MQCPTCKQELESGIRFCPHDGTPLTQTASVDVTNAPDQQTTLTSPPAPPEIALPLTVGGRYRLLQVRGGGGMATVYRAVDATLDREVAVKLINPQLRNEATFDARFQREARIASQLADPHIIVVHDYGIDAAHGPYLVMEYLHGQSLRERLNREGSLPLSAALQLSGQLLLALIHAHSKGIIHRDIKPDNIFLLSSSETPAWFKKNRLQVRVLDFGIARIYRGPEEGNAAALTNPGAVVGTPRYMAPEQLAGQKVEASADLYSAAMVIHEALTGQLPYVGGQTLCQLCPAAPPALQELLLQCLKPNAGERPAAAVEVFLRLQSLGRTRNHSSPALEIAAGTNAVPLPDAPTIAYLPPRRRMLRRAVFAAALLLTLLALAVGGKYLLFPRRVIDRQHASLLGVHVGDAQQETVERLRLTKGGPMNPWAAPHVPHYLGNVLQAKDLGLSAADLARLDVQRSADDRICVLFLDDQVRAVVARAPHHAATGRGLKIRDKQSRVMDFYPEAPSSDVVREVRDDDNDDEEIEIRRYDALGIGFELHGAKVTAITVYPAVKRQAGVR